MTARPDRKARGRYHHGDLRGALLAAARQVVQERGAEAVQLRELARALGVNHRAVYRHFTDRDDLVASVALDGWERLAAVVRAAGDAGAEPVHVMLGAYVEFALEERGRYRAMLGPGSPGMAGRPALRRGVLDAIRLVEVEVAEQTGEKGAAVRDRVFAIWGLAHGLCDLALGGHARVSSRRAGRAWVLRLAEPLLADAGLR